MTDVLTVLEIDLLIDAAAQGATEFTLPSGVTVKKPNLESLMTLREFRKSQEHKNRAGIVVQHAEFR